MSTRKPRKSLDEALASEFVHGSQSPLEEQPAPSALQPSTFHKTQDTSPKPAAQPPMPSQPSSNQSFISKLMDTPDKEPVVRLTVDLPESMHRRLSILCARTGKKKAEVIRMLLNEVLIDVSE